jgi:hypothetical protein
VPLTKRPLDQSLLQQLLRARQYSHELRQPRVTKRQISSGSIASVRRQIRSLKGTPYVIILGIILLIIGIVASIPILLTVGVILVIVGLLLEILGATGRAVGGRRHYY